jgi:hypothetical protein
MVVDFMVFVFIVIDFLVVDFLVVDFMLFDFLVVDFMLFDFLVVDHFSYYQGINYSQKKFYNPGSCFTCYQVQCKLYL